MRQTKWHLLSAFVLLAFLATAKELCAADLTVKVAGFKHENGGALVYLWKEAKGFPKEPERAYQKQNAEIKGKAVTVVFKDVEPGTYSVSVTHDENGNGKLDTGFMGKPKEGYGTSNNPKTRFSAPSFDDCKFAVSGERTIEIQLNY